MKKIIIIIIIIGLCLIKLHAVTDYLKIGNTGGVSGVCNSVSPGIESLFWNPANLCEINDLEVMATYSMLYQDMHYYGAGVSKRFEKIGTFGLGVLLFNSGDIAIPVYENDEYFNSGLSYSANSYNINLTYSREIFKNVLSGISLKGLSSSMEEESSGFIVGGDVGVKYNRIFKNLNVNGVLRNINIIKGKYISENVGFANEVVLGLDYAIALDQKDKYDLKPMVELGKEFNGDWKADVSLEIGVWKLMKFGAGYRLNNDKGNLAIGGSIIYREIEVNYRWTGFSEFGNIHSIGLIYRSERIVPKLPAFHR